MGYFTRDKLGDASGIYMKECVGMKVHLYRRLRDLLLTGPRSVC